MVRRFGDAAPVLDHLAVGTDPHCRSDDSLHGLAVHLLLTEGFVLGHHLAVRVRQQVEVQGVLVDELAVTLDAVRGDPQDHRIEGLDLAVEVPEATGLLGATGRVVSGVEVEDDILTSVILE